MRFNKIIQQIKLKYNQFKIVIKTYNYLIKLALLKPAERSYLNKTYLAIVTLLGINRKIRP